VTRFVLASRYVRRVLVVHDDSEVAAMLGRIVSILGHECVVTTSAHEALTRAGSLQPEIGIVDVELSDLSGYELARRLRAAHGTRMFLAAITDPAIDPRESFAAGFDHHVVKPIGVDLVQQLLECAHERLGIT
jgi:CheY-like chemotaxis protein